MNVSVINYWNYRKFGMFWRRINISVFKKLKSVVASWLFFRIVFVLGKTKDA
jgi:hypothetical protein